MALPFGLEWSDIRRASCCCGVVPDSCSDCVQDTSLPCMRVRHVDWDASIPSLWVRAGANNGLTGYCGEAVVSDQIGNGLDRLGPWSFDFVDTAETPGYLVCNCETVFASTVCTRAVPEGWISGFSWDAGPSCSTNRVTFEGGILSGGEYTTGVLFEKFLPAQFWENEFQVGDWVFTPATSCGLNGNGPTCFRVIRTVGDAFDVYCDIANTHAPASWGVLRCSVSSREESAYNVYGVQAGDEASAGYLRNADGSTPQVVVSWVINADRDTVRLMVEEISYNAGLPGWEIVASDYIEFAYAANWWTTGRLVGDFTVDPCPACEAYSCFPDCLVVNCGSGPQPNALFATVSSLNGCCVDGSYSFTWNGTSVWYYLKIGDDTLVTCGKIEIWYECNSTTFRRRVKVTDVNGGVSDTTENDAGGCSGGDFADSFTVPSTFLAPLCFNEAPFFTDTVTIDVST